MPELFLAGDIGGTKTNVGLFSRRNGALQLESEARFPTADYASLDTILDEFLKSEKPVAASFGVAGPVRDNFADSTNFPWDVDGNHISNHLAGIPVTVINDMVAMAWGALSLPADRFVELNAGRRDPTGNAALIAAGTGLGEALMTRNGNSWIPVPTEGGHTSFAPESPLQDELLEWLREDASGHSDDGHVSFERVVCGPGLVNIYRFLRDTGRGEEFDWMYSRMEAEDPARVIADLALEKRSPLCEAALELFVSIYGSEAGNLALKGLASGGVFIGGGIAPKILPALQGGTFLNAFFNKGRMRKLVEAMPVRIMIEPQAPLFGAGVLRCKLFDAAMSDWAAELVASDYYWLLLIGGNLPVFFLLGYVFFDSWGGLFKSIFYLFKSNMLSLFDGEFHEDRFETAKFWCFIVTCVVLVISEHAFLQNRFG